MKSQPTLRDAMLYFSEFEHCKEFMTELRWPDGKVKCPQCGSEKVTWLANPRVWKCYGKHARPTFTLKTGTIFEDSPIGLEKWLPCAWLLINCKNGISSYEVSRDLGVTQKTAWFMLHRVRLAMQDDLKGGMLSGEIEVDETFIGGKARNMHKSKRLEKLGGSHHGVGGKEMVFGMVERDGKVRTIHVGGRSKPILQEKIKQNVEAGSAIFSDELDSYDGLSPDFKHEVVNHAVEYVRDNVHTNTMENFWSLLKRGLHGTYISVEPFHLFRYLDEQAFRYNHRKTTDAERFAAVLKHIVGRRLTYEQLTGKAQATQHG
jgi:transposase-like protein